MIEKKQKLRGRCGRKGPIDGQGEFPVRPAPRRKLIPGEGYAPVQAKPPKPDAHGEVYFLLSKHGDLVKIGFTTNLDKRIAHLRTGHPGAKLLASFDGWRSDEKQVHRLWAEDRIEGEWFRYDTGLDWFVGDLMEARDDLHQADDIATIGICLSRIRPRTNEDSVKPGDRL